MNEKIDTDDSLVSLLLIPLAKILGIIFLVLITLAYGGPNTIVIVNLWLIAYVVISKFNHSLESILIDCNKK